MVFAARQLQEKSMEQHQDLYMPFSVSLSLTLSRSNNGATRSNAQLGPVMKLITTLKYKI